MRKLKLYSAMSLDGFIAGPNGEIGWLDEPGRDGANDEPAAQGSSGEDYGYQEFYDSVDTTLMGMETYRLISNFDEFPYENKTNFVFTRSQRPHAQYVSFVSDDIAGFTRGLKEQPGRDIWLVGGGQVSAVMLNEGLIDEMILTVFPLVIGNGIPVFAPSALLHRLSTVSCETYDSGLIQWRLINSEH
jgi:dihydrofolate reductase